MRLNMRLNMRLKAAACDHFAAGNASDDFDPLRFARFNARFSFSVLCAFVFSPELLLS